MSIDQRYVGLRLTRMAEHSFLLSILWTLFDERRRKTFAGVMIGLKSVESDKGNHYLLN